jgi:hypothetical protein
MLGSKWRRKMKKNEVAPFERLTFPKVENAAMAFGQYDNEWFKSVMAIEPLPGDSKWEDVAMDIFYKGGTVPINMELDKEYLQLGMRMFSTVIGSWNPKHEHKQKVCGLILKSICEK